MVEGRVILSVLDGDMLEAQAFGWLAARVMRGLPTSGPSTTAVPDPCCGGRISYPRRRRELFPTRP